MRWRHKYACGHSSEITDREEWPPVAYCSKCAGHVPVVSTKRLKDTARMPSETRKGRDQEARVAARSAPPPNYAARHWKVM